jgi:transposase
VVRRLALRLAEHLRTLTAEIDELAAEIAERVAIVAPSPLAIVGCSALTAANLVGETAVRELLARRKSNGDGGMEALRIPKRRLSDVVYRAMLSDQNQTTLSAA